MAAPSDKTPLIALEVLAGPLDGLRCEGRRDSFHLGRSEGAGPGGVRNDLVIQRDSYASSFHAVIYEEKGKWWLKDKGSTNGTWLAEKKMEPNQPGQLHDGEALVVGNTVLRFAMKSAGLPPVDPSASSALSPASQTILNRARAIAQDKQIIWAGVASLFRALAESEGAPLPEFFKNADLDPTRAVTLIDEWNRWQRDLEWVGKDILRSRRLPDRAVSTVLPTPRMQMILTLALAARDACGAPHIEPIHLLLAIFREGGSRPALALETEGYPRERLAAVAEGIIQQIYAPAAPEATMPPAESTLCIAPPKPAAPAVPQRRPVDPETWLLARELMDRLQQIQAEFHLAEPGGRFDALCVAIRETLQKAPPLKRGILAEQVYYLFPVLEDSLVPPPAVAAEPTPPSLKTDGGESTDKHAEATDKGGNGANHPREEHESGFDSDELLQMIFGTERLAQTINESSDATTFLRIMQHLYTFALDMERLAKGLVQTVQGGGGGESRYFLPFSVHDLKMMVQKLLADRQPETVMEIRDYLYDLGHWLIALIAAHQKGVSQWNKELWDRISPQAIRNQAQVSSINKALGLGKADLWQTYERVSRDLRPEITEDQFNDKIGRLATEEFRRLSSH